MADDEADSSQKTEEPTLRRLEEARNKGQVIFSREVTNLFLFLTILGLLIFMAGPLGEQTARALRYYIEQAPLLSLSGGVVKAVSLHAFRDLAQLLAIPLIALALVAVVSALLQHQGLMFSSEALMPKLERISVLKGIGRLFSMRTVVELVKGIIKIIVVGTVGYLALSPYLPVVKGLFDTSLMTIMAAVMMLLRRMLMGICIVMALIAALDYFYQRYEFYKSMRMSKQEIKEEMRQTEGSPEVKAKLRQIMSSRARKRMMAAVPKADVVIVNPTHYAIALAYRPDEMDAPKVVAKGQDNIAKILRDLAKKHNVPIVQNPPLARVLYEKVEVDSLIPVELYAAVAEIISYIFKMKGKR
jgi:flagellar biosynthetic protein FlhB